MTSNRYPPTSRSTSIDVNGRRLSARLAVTRNDWKVCSASCRSATCLSSVRSGAEIQRHRLGEEDVRHAAGSSDTFNHQRRRGRVGNGDPDAPLQRFDPSNLQIFQCQPEIADEPLLEEVAVAAFEGEFVVVDDGAVHSVGC